MASSRVYPALILLACVVALAGALTAQFAFGLRPCVLCLYQRVPFSLGALWALLALTPAVPVQRRAVLIWLCAVVFAANAGIAMFHVGVEQHWWAGTAACTGTEKAATTPAELMAALNGPPPARCDEIPWSLFGISMAGFNVPFSLALAAFATWAARRMRIEA